MASQSLYRKWRSQTFSELVGQEAVVHTLKNALSSGKLAHAYLFTGPRGTGKTSMARLLAKTINCANPQNGEPCNECQQCREITAGNSFNVIEIDAASNRGIDSIRELREKVMMPPSTGRYKVYILDEAHMLTVEAFNALLKTLEEPPPHAIFVMATTDVHKMLPTVLSRCQRFDFKRFSMRQLVAHLNFVAQQEQITLEGGAAELIARAAAGGMRDALSLLDQAVAYSGERVTLAQVQAMLGVADPRAIQKLILSIAHLDSATGLHLIHELSEAGADLRQVNSQLAEYCRAMMLAQAGANIAEILDSTEDEVREITQNARFFALEELTECARIFAQNELVQKSQATPQLGLELALLACIDLHRRMQTELPTTLSSTAARPAHSTRSARSAPALLSRPPAQEPTSPVEHSPLSMADMPETPSQHGRPASEPEDLAGNDAIALLPADQRAEEVTPVHMEETPVQVSHQVSQESDVAETLPPLSRPVSGISAGSENSTVTETGDEGYALSLTVQQVKERWEYIKRRIRTQKDGGKIAAFLNGYTIVGVEGSDEAPVVLLMAQADFHFKALQQHQAVVEWGMKIELNLPACRVRLMPPVSGKAGSLAPFPQIDSPSPPVLPASASTAVQTSQSPAHRERPERPERPAPAKPAQKQRSAGRAKSSLPPESPQSATGDAVPGASGDANFSSPLARTQAVRENTTTEPVNPNGRAETQVQETRLEATRKKATAHPVVQKAVEMFKAEIKNVNLK
ncbi:MAG: DNA polymerase III subunit gamma/tau [Ktedonobacteraceae bacterium]|nr:DNA polymerase III subunit gamma/tau [Ktedonobacteraceae bacterium]